MLGPPGFSRHSVLGPLLTTVVFSAGAVFGGVSTAAGARVAVPGVADMAGLCGHFRIVPTPDGRALCSHGPDPAPAGVDYRVPRHPVAPGQAQGLIFTDPPGAAPTKAAAAPGIGCYGTGQDGNRVQAIYAFPADHPDRYAQLVPSIRQWAAETDAVYQASAACHGFSAGSSIARARPSPASARVACAPAFSSSLKGKPARPTNPASTITKR